MNELATIVEVPTFGDLLFRAERDAPHNLALVFENQRFTYTEFADRVRRRAKSLIALGVKHGDHVGIMMPNSVEYLELLFAIASVGAVTVSFNTRYREHELRFVLAHADAVLLFTAGKVANELDYVERLIEAFPPLAAGRDEDGVHCPETPYLREVVVVGTDARGFMSWTSFAELGADLSDDDVNRRRHAVAVRDPCTMLYTSGTTSLPKGCLLSHESVVRGCQGPALYLQLTERDRYWVILPLFHMGGVNPLGSTFWVKGAFITASRFDAGDGLKTMEREGATAAFLAFPAIINDLIHHPLRPSTDLSKLRVILSSASVQPREVRELLLETFPNAIQVGSYGMTEVGGALTYNAVYDPEGSGLRNVGRPIPGMTIQVVDEDGAVLPPNTPGEILIKGYGLFECYYNNPEQTAELYHGGWIHSGDRGSINERGELTYLGRIKDMLKIGGENVAAAEIEAYIHAHPAVKLCQVVSMPHPRLAEVAAAFIELRPGQTATEEEIIDFCRGKISSFKVPRAVRFVSEWPLTASSKVQKVKLREQIRAEMEADTTA